MRTYQFIHRYFTIGLVLALLSPLQAQTGQVPKAYTTGEAILDLMAFPTNAPFVVSWISVGTDQRNTSTGSGKVARDSSGKTIVERDSLKFSGLDASTFVPNFELLDLKSQISVDWNAGSRQAILIRTPKISEEQKLAFEKTWAIRIWAEPMNIAFDPIGGQYGGGQYKVEQLGTKDIFGVRAKGILATRVLPMQLDGRDQPVTVTEERWSSEDLQITLIDVVEDPRVGRSTWRVTSLERVEPDPALFRIPAGYTVVARNAGTQKERSATAGEPQSVRSIPVP